MEKLSPRWGYLILITTMCGFSTMQLGTALTASTVAFVSLKTHLGMNGNSLMANLEVEYNSYLSSSSILGVAFGSLFGGILI